MDSREDHHTLKPRHQLLKACEREASRLAGRWMAMCSCGWQTPESDLSGSKEGAEAGWLRHALSRR